MSGQRIAILRALTQPPLLLHCDRELLLMAGGISVFGLVRLGMFDGNLYWCVASVVFFFASYGLLVWAAKKDPQGKDVLFRAWRYLPLWKKSVHYARTARVGERSPGRH